MSITSSRLFARRGASPAASLLTAETDTEPQTLWLYDEISPWGITARDVATALDQATGPLLVRINSPGGDVFDGIAIANALRRYRGGPVTTQVDGLAASMASVLMLVGVTRLIAADAFVMIHDPWSVTVGPAAEHRATAALLDQIAEASLVPAYSVAMDLEGAAVRALMAAETWWSGSEAVENGMATALLPTAVGATAMWDVTRFRQVPAALRAEPAEPVPADPPPVRRLERALRDAGFSRSEARRMAAACMDSPGASDDDAADWRSTLEAAVAALRTLLTQERTR